MGTSIVPMPQPPSDVARSERTDINALMEMALTSNEVTPEKLAQLFDLKVRIDARGAEAEFNRDFTALQMALPRVKKNGTINMGDKGAMRFARWEDVDAAIRPILALHGFVLSFSSEPVPSGVLMVCTLTHKGGHSKQSRMQLPPDSGAGRNGLQAIGSSRSYGKRYLALDILNIVTEGADDDGKTAEPISQDQADTINALISELGMDAEAKQRFLKYAGGAKSVALIQRNQYERCVAALERKRREMGE